MYIEKKENFSLDNKKYGTRVLKTEFSGYKNQD